MHNPIRNIREEMGLTRLEMSLRHGIGYSSIVHCELGYSDKLGKGIRRFLQTKNYDIDAIERDYSLWRKSLLRNNSMNVDKEKADLV